LKERLLDILAWRHHRQVPVVLLMDGWIRWARRCGLPAFKPLGGDLSAPPRRHSQHACACQLHAIAESINADAQSTIARAYGFRNLRTIVYLLKARLDLPASPFRSALT
jgi:hypothetical protein